MAYIGRPLQVANLAVQSGTGDGSDTTPIATLDYATTTNGIAVYLDGVRQLAGTDFNVTAQTTLTFTTAPANGVGVDVYFLGLELSIPTPADATVTAAKLASNAVTTAKIIANAVDETKLKDALIGDFTDATVTASDYFLHGDATDSGNTKKDTVQGILDLVPAAGMKTFRSSFTADRATTGSQSVTGVGFTPKVIFAMTFRNTTTGYSIGQGTFNDSTASSGCWFGDYNGASGTTAGDNFLYRIDTSGTSNSSKSVIASFDSDGFTITKTKSNTPTGTIHIYYTVLG